MCSLAFLDLVIHNSIACIHTSTCRRTHSYANTQTDIHKHVNRHAHRPTHKHTNTQAYTFTQTYTHTHTRELQSPRDHVENPDAEIARDIVELYNAGENRYGKDDEVFITIVTKHDNE